MILVIARLRVVRGAMGAMLKELDAFAGHTRNEHGCVEYTPLRSLEDDDLIVIVERWQDRESLDAHLSSLEMASYRQATAQLVAQREHLVASM